jgi:hypothetical protein
MWKRLFVVVFSLNIFALLRPAYATDASLRSAYFFATDYTDEHR